MAGLARGLAEGLESGLALRDAENERRFARSMARRRQALAEQGQEIRASAESRAQARAALGAIANQKAELGLELGDAVRRGDRGGLADLYRRKGALEDAEHEAYRHLGGAELHDEVRAARQTLHDWHSGRRTVAETSPAETHRAISFAAERPLADILDTADGPSALGLQLQAFEHGRASLPRDGGAGLLRAANALYRHSLHGLIGQQAYDGSTVTDADLAAPVPHPRDPRHMLLTARLTTRDPASGRTGTVHVPVTEAHGHMLAHPEERADALVKTMRMDDLFNHAGALDTLYKAVNGEPGLRRKLIESYLQGHDDYISHRLDWLQVLGHDPAEYLPRHHLSVDDNGQVRMHTHRPAAAPPRTNAKGWRLHRDAGGNLAYVAPDRSRYEEVR